MGTWSVKERCDKNELNLLKTDMLDKMANRSLLVVNCCREYCWNFLDIDTGIDNIIISYWTENLYILFLHLFFFNYKKNINSLENHYFFTAKNFFSLNYLFNIHKVN